MSSTLEYRRHQPADRREVFVMFRDSVFDFARQIGFAGPDEQDDVDAAWERQGPLAAHLEETAAEDWVAEVDGHIVGWARSVERDGHLQLTHFFVDPSSQGRGVGRGLLERAFHPDLAEQRSVMATQNPLALSLYLRAGLEFRGLTLEVGGAPRPRDIPESVELAESGLTEDVIAMDRDILGFDRSIDLRFLADDRPVYVASRAGEMIGYVFGSNGASMGPGGAVSPEDLPLILAAVDDAAARRGIPSVRYTLPGPAAPAVRWALEAGHHIEPFYEVLLTTTERLRLDRYLMTQPGFIW